MSAILSRGRWVKWYLYTLHSGTSNIKRHCISNYHADSNTTGVPGMITPWGVVSACSNTSSSIFIIGSTLSWLYFFFVEIFFLAEMFSSSRKRFLPRRNDFFLAEMISLSLKWFLLQGNDIWYVKGIGIISKVRKYLNRILYLICLTHLYIHILLIATRCGVFSEQNGRHFADDILICIFVNEKFYVLIKISLKFVPKGPIVNSPALV